MKQDNIQLLKQREANRKSYLLHKEERIKKIKQYELENREKILQGKRDYYYRNREKIKNQINLYQKNNRTIVNIRVRNYYKNVLSKDIFYKIRAILRNRVQFIVKYYKGKKPSSALKMLGCNLEQFREHLQSNFLPGMTWSNYGKWHIDHIKPLACFNLKEEEQVKACCHYTNLQPLWASDNIKKGKKY